MIVCRSLLVEHRKGIADTNERLTTLLRELFTTGPDTLVPQSRQELPDITVGGTGQDTYAISNEITGQGCVTMAVVLRSLTA